MTNPELDGDALACVMGSERRQRIVATLYDSPGTPTWIADQTKILRPNVSNQLSELEGSGVVESLTPEGTRKGRVYGLTDEGRAIVEGIDAIGVGGDE